MLPAISFQEILVLPFLLMRGDKFLISTFSCLFYIQVGKGKKLSWVLFNLWFEENMFSVKLSLCYTRQWGFSVAQTVRNLPVMWETWVWSLGLEGPLGKGMATHSSILLREIPRTEEPGRLQSTGLQRVGHDWVTNTFTFRISSSCNIILLLLRCIEYHREGTEISN